MRKPISSHFFAIASAIAATGLLVTPASTQQSTAPIARYAIDAGTISGMAAMGGGMGGAMSMMFGGGDRTAHELVLRLGSSQSPTGGAAKAEHFMPPGARLGKSVPLLTPTPSAGSTEDAPPSQFQRPKGRLLIYWGCGAAAQKGQPVILDFARLTAGQVPPGLFASAAAVPNDPRIGPSNSRTYGDWPNGKTAKPIPAASSLIGDHRIAGNYSPEIRFALAQDYLPALNGQSRETAAGATQLSWNSVAGATGYYAWVMGFNPGPNGEANDMVWWASSSSQQFGGALWEWLSPSTVQKLIGQKIVMPPAQTSCVVPAEVKKAAGQFMMGNLYAYGPEENFAFPPRPADPKIVWKPDWTARVRYRAHTMWMLSGGMGGGMGAAMSGAAEGEEEDRPAPRRKCRGGLGGILAGAAGTGC